LKIIFEKDKDFKFKFEMLVNNRTEKVPKLIRSQTERIIDRVKKDGDNAILYYTKKFDNNKISKNNIIIDKKTINYFAKKADIKILNSFKLAIKRITKFHQKQYPNNYKLSEKGISIFSKWSPIDSVGLYVPGGGASYPSTLIMNLVPAKIAGVKRIVVSMPCKDGKFNPYIMAIIKHFNVDEVYQIGGAQAIAALAYGTKTIKSVDKIFGPGNIYVNEAKKIVFGKVGIDLVAGPSEIVVVASKNNQPKWVASDLIAQAEHDIMSKSILITDSYEFAAQVESSLKILKKGLTKSDTIKKSINKFGAIIVLKSLRNSYKYINILAPEHLHIHSSDYKNIYSKIRNAGAIFVGQYSSESFGDYISGTNHILPTGGSAKFMSGLGVLDFMKRNTYTKINKNGFRKLYKQTKNMAEIEGLEAHKLSIQIRED
tara:strand:+ start:10679 stop:11965 length:1287 start_codon:yes stop_codon:yes gene_type:complete